MSPARINASSVTNPYADRHRPREAAPIDVIAQHTGAPAHRIAVTTGARHALGRLLTGPVLLTLPTSPAYLNLVRGPVIVHQLEARRDFALDLDALERKVLRFRPDGPARDPEQPGRQRDRHQRPRALPAPHQRRAGDRRRDLRAVRGQPLARPAGGGVRAPDGRRQPAPEPRDRRRVRRRARTPPSSRHHLPFCALPDGLALRTYIREARAFHANLALLPGSRTFPSASNFALMSTYRPAPDVIRDLAEYGIDVRDCADQWVLNRTRYLRLAARTAQENERIVATLREVLSVRLALAS